MSCSSGCAMKFNQTFIIVTHNDELAALSDRRLLMKDGLIIQ